MRRKIVVASGLIVLCIIAIVATNGYLKTHTPTRNLSKEFIGYVLKNDSSLSYALFSEGTQRTQRPDEWKLTVQDISTYFEGKSPVFIYENISQKSTTDVYSITGLNEHPYTFTLQMTKNEKGKWAVESFLSAVGNTTTNSESRAGGDSGKGTGY